MSSKKVFSFLQGQSVDKLIVLSVLSLIMGLSFIGQSYTTYTYNTRASEPTYTVACPNNTVSLFTLGENNFSVPGTTVEPVSNSWYIEERNNIALVHSDGILRLTFPYPITFDSFVLYNATIKSNLTGPETINGEMVTRSAFQNSDTILYPRIYPVQNKGPHTTLEYMTNGGDTAFNICIAV